MNYFFITGMIRSGTTLLEKLISNISSASVLSQPFPQLFINVKKKFHQSINHKEKYHVLSNYIDETQYKIQDFTNFLIETEINSKLINTSINTDYSGQLTKLKIGWYSKNNAYFSQWHKKICFNERYVKKTSLCGSKEVMCEEFIPYFSKQNIKSLIIIRDPRDVMSSIHKGKGSTYVGNHRPLLLDLQNWRKSFYIALGNVNNKNVKIIKYEELVNIPTIKLKEIGEFLNLNNINIEICKSGLLNQNGEVWKNNSSFNLEGIISNKSVSNFKKQLSQAQIEFIEAICYREMNYLGYNTSTCKNNFEDIILNYHDELNIKDNQINNKYKAKGIMRSIEIKKLNGESLNSYIYPDNFKILNQNEHKQRA